MSAPLNAGGAFDVFPLCLGGNVFGWTADAERSFAVLDAYTAAGGNFVDTSDNYSAFVPGNEGGESETIIGAWLHARRNRDDVQIATKVGKHPGRQGVSGANVKVALEDSLRRLRTDYIDLYYAHIDDSQTPLEETLVAFDALVKEGKVLAIGASNYSAARLAEALDVSEREGLAAFVALQPLYNLVDRSFENELQRLCLERRVACVPYAGLAGGFLTGKYRPGGPDVQSPRAGGAKALLDERGVAILEALDEVADARGVAPATIALAWLRARPSVLAPIASARTPEQLGELLAIATFELSADEVARLTAAST